MKIGFIINPISGMGGRVGLKGTDNLAELAARLGGEPVSLVRAEQALHSIEEKDDMFFLTCSGKMGDSVLGVKIFSPVFCVTPKECGRIVSTFTETSVKEVLDIGYVKVLSRYHDFKMMKVF